MCNDDYNRAWQRFEVAAKILDAARLEFMRASQAYGTMLRIKFHEENFRASITHLKDPSARMLIPVLLDATLDDYDVVTFSDAQPQP